MTARDRIKVHRDCVPCSSVCTHQKNVSCFQFVSRNLFEPHFPAVIPVSGLKIDKWTPPTGLNLSRIGAVCHDHVPSVDNGDCDPGLFWCKSLPNDTPQEIAHYSHTHPQLRAHSLLTQQQQQRVVATCVLFPPSPSLTHHNHQLLDHIILCAFDETEITAAKATKAKQQHH